MPVPNLHIFHPSEHRRPGITALLAEVETTLHEDAKWDGCKTRRVQYDDQGSFDVPTQADLVRRAPGPVIIIQKVQARVHDHFVQVLRRVARVYHVPVGAAEDLWAACEEAHQAYQNGEPLVPMREMVAFLIVRKLASLERWGGKKGYLWEDNLPRGGFPRDLVTPRDVYDVAAELVRNEVLQTKTSMGAKKFALGDKSIVQPILDTKSFVNVPSLAKFFAGSKKLVTARLLDYDS